MASWADLQDYDEMIEALNSFCRDVSGVCETMTAAAQQCVNVLEKDVVSVKASNKVLLSVNEYNEAIVKAQNLISCLEEEKQAIIEMLNSVDE